MSLLEGFCHIYVEMSLYRSLIVILAVFIAHQESRIILSNFRSLCLAVFCLIFLVQQFFHIIWDYCSLSGSPYSFIVVSLHVLVALFRYSPRETPPITTILRQLCVLIRVLSRPVLHILRPLSFWSLWLAWRRESTGECLLPFDSHLLERHDRCSSISVSMTTDTPFDSNSPLIRSYSPKLSKKVNSIGLRSSFITVYNNILVEHCL